MAPSEKPDRWHDFRRGIALLCMVIFFFCLVALAFVTYKVATLGSEAPFDLWSFLGFLSFAVPLGVASWAGLGVYRARTTEEARRKGRTMALWAVLAVALGVITGVLGDLR